MGRPGKNRVAVSGGLAARPGVRNGAARRAHAMRLAALAQASASAVSGRTDEPERSSSSKGLLTRALGYVVEERALIGLVFLPVLAGTFWVVWTKAWLPPTLQELIAKLPAIAVQAKSDAFAVASPDRIERPSPQNGGSAPAAAARPNGWSDAITLLPPVAPDVEAQSVSPEGIVSAIDREALAFIGRERACTVEEAELAGLEPPVEIFDGSDEADDPQFGVKLAAAAMAQTGDFVVYTDSYRQISFPMGDVSALYGVCTDVIIRAYRSLGIDLQAAVKRSRVGSGDPSIDHRRTETLRRFFARNGTDVPVTDFAEDYLPGDIVTYHRPQNSGSQSHIAIVTDRMSRSGRPMIVHNRGWGPQIEDGLFVDRITGHYRYRGGLATSRDKAQARSGKLPALKVITQKLKKAGKTAPRADKKLRVSGGSKDGVDADMPTPEVPQVANP